MSSQAKTLVVVFDNTISHVFGAHILVCADNKKYVYQFVEDPECLSEQINKENYKNVLLVSSRFYKHYGLLKDCNVSIFVDINETSSDEKLPENFKYIYSEKSTGFATWAIKQVNIKGKHLTTFANYLDQQLCSYATEETCNFQTGIYAQAGDTNSGKLSSAIDVSIGKIIEDGKIQRLHNIPIINERFKTSKIIMLKCDDKEYKTRVTCGWMPVTDTCLRLLEDTQVDCALLIGHDLRNNRTQLILRTNNKEIHAGKLIKKLYGGGGYVAQGGATID